MSAVAAAAATTTSTSTCAYVYTLTDVLTSIMPTLVQHALPKDALDALNELCRSADCCVAVQPYYTAKGILMSRGGGGGGGNGVTTGGSASSSSSYDNKHRRGGEKGGIAKEEFHVTKWGSAAAGGGSGGKLSSASSSAATGKSKLEADIDVLRLLLNKVSPKTVTDLSQQLETRLLEVVINDGTGTSNEAEVVAAQERIASMIYQVASASKFYSRLFAELYAHLAGQFAWIRAHFAIQQAKLLESYAPFVSVSPDTDYDGFCKMNKANDARKALTTFYMVLAGLGMEGSKEAVEQLSAHLLARVREGASASAASRHEVEEWMGHLALLAPVLSESARADLAEMTKWSPKELPGWSNQALFKCMDIIDTFAAKSTK